jgi:hypothetical protein
MESQTFDYSHIKQVSLLTDISWTTGDLDQEFLNERFRKDPECFKEKLVQFAIDLKLNQERMV